MWTYVQDSGEIFDSSGHCLDVGYSGHGACKNKPDCQSMKNMGPCPVGTYAIGKSFHHPQKGPICMRLTPFPGNEMYGREGFMIHGDSISNPGTASDGCIILSRTTREAIDDSGDSSLQVISTKA